MRRAVGEAQRGARPPSNFPDTDRHRLTLIVICGDLHKPVSPESPWPGGGFGVIANVAEDIRIMKMPCGQPAGMPARGRRDIFIPMGATRSMANYTRQSPSSRELNPPPAQPAAPCFRLAGSGYAATPGLGSAMISGNSGGGHRIFVLKHRAPLCECPGEILFVEFDVLGTVVRRQQALMPAL